MISKKLIPILALGFTSFAVADLSDNSKQLEQDVQQLREEMRLLKKEIAQQKEEVNELFRFKREIEQVWDRVKISPWMPRIVDGSMNQRPLSN